MPTKRTLLVTVVLALALTVSGCSALQGDSANVDTDSVANQTQQAMQDVDTFTFDAQMSMSSDQMPQAQNLSATGAVNLTTAEARMEMTGPAATTQTYFVNETMYMKTQGTWVKQAMSTANASGQANVSQANVSQGNFSGQQQFLNATTVTFEGNTTIDGQDVYEFTADIDEEQLQEMMPQQQGMAAMMSFEDLTYTVYVTHDDYYFKRLTADATMSMQGQSTDVDMQVTLDNFNEPVTIDLPDAARNAQPFGTG